MKTAILFGASGFIGSFLLEDLLGSPDYGRVNAVVRRALDITHPKLTTLIGDFNSLPQLKDKIVADEIFIALGTTKKNTPNQEEYYHVDHDYPVMAARFAKENGARAVFIVSAVGANPSSNIFYVKMKGETERDIVGLDYDHTHIFRPSMLMGSRKENRPAEKVFQNIISVLNPLLIGRLKKYRGIEGKDVARAMVNAAKSQREKVKIYHWPEMQELL